MILINKKINNININSTVNNNDVLFCINLVEVYHHSSILHTEEEVQWGPQAYFIGR